MKKSWNQFFLTLVLLTLVLLLVFWASIHFSGLEARLLPFGFSMIALTFFTTLVSGRKLIFSADRQAGALVRASMASTVIKFLVNLFFLFIAMYISGDKLMNKGIVAVFFVSYLVLTAYEKWFVIRKLRD